MKSLATVFAISCFATAANAQENYTMKMTVKTEGLPAEYAAYGEQEIVTYVKGEKSKTEVNSMMFNTTVYFDGKKLTSLSDIMGNKSGYTATKEEIESQEKDKPAKPVIEYTAEKKQIAGYECTKAIATSVGKDKKEKKTILWVTDKIKYDKNHSKASGRGMTDFGDLKGHPLGMEMTQDMQGSEMKIVMTTTEVSTNPIEDSVFAVNTEGYKMMTYQQFQEQMKAMQGGK
jgi:hypothetical protein